MAVASRPRPRRRARDGQRGMSARWWLTIALGITIGLPLLSAVFGLYDRLLHWGKLVHGVDAFLVTLLFGMLLIAWRDAQGVDLSDELAALTSTFVGIFFGVMWEIVEFVVDWITYSDLQKSNADTMTDFLWNDFGAVIGAVLAVRACCHWLSASQRSELGEVGNTLVDGPSRLLNRHGILMTLVTAAVIAAAVVALWFSDRPVPGVQIP